MSVKNPCKNCDQRELGCHSKCPEYLAFRAERDELLLKRYEEHEMSTRLVELHIHSHDVRGERKRRKKNG